MMAVVFVRRRTLRSARPLAIASGRIVVQHDEHAIRVAEIALILLDPRPRQRRLNSVSSGPPNNPPSKIRDVGNSA
jgi:hypothetical protein